MWKLGSDGTVEGGRCGSSLNQDGLRSIAKIVTDANVRNVTNRPTKTSVGGFHSLGWSY